MNCSFDMVLLEAGVPTSCEKNHQMASQKTHYPKSCHPLCPLHLPCMMYVLRNLISCLNIRFQLNLQQTAYSVLTKNCHWVGGFFPCYWVPQYHLNCRFHTEGQTQIFLLLLRTDKSSILQMRLQMCLNFLSPCSQTTISRVNRTSERTPVLADARKMNYKTPTHGFLGERMSFVLKILLINHFPWSSHNWIHAFHQNHSKLTQPLLCLIHETHPQSLQYLENQLY